MRLFVIVALIIVNILSAGIVLADGQSNSQVYHLNQYPDIGLIFHWGMNKGQVETALKKPLADMGRSSYQVSFSSGGIDYDATLVIADEGLEALVLRFYIAPEKFNSLVDSLGNLYGKPSAIDTSKGAVQWKDNVNDTGVVITGEKDGLYWVTVGMRLLKGVDIVDGLGPGKISSLEGVVLGMTKEDFLKKKLFFEAKRLQPEPGASFGAEVYQAFLTVDLIQSEAFFEFNQGKLAYIMIYVPIETSDKDVLNKAFQEHLSFLSKIYGNPSNEENLMVSWNDKVAELRYGLHPLGKFVVSWQLL